MKRIFIVASLFIISQLIVGQSSSHFYCTLGIDFEISQRTYWGYKKPVVMLVDPLSPASEAGIKMNDIIEEINGVKTTEKSSEEINQLIQSTNNETNITISNYQGTQKLILKKDCKLANTIDEKQLAEAYAFYSLEDINIRSFTCPFKTTVNSGVDLLSYHSFGFSTIDPNNEQLEENIYKQIKNCLEQKGLIYDEKDPELIINTYYFYNRNPNFKRSENSDKLPTEYRYNISTKKMENLPIYFNPLIHSNQAEFLLNLGIRIADRKKSAPNNLFIIWECEANELLQSNFSLSDYAKFHIPLMFMQFPYPKLIESAKFSYKSLRYNYTGIGYNIDNLDEVAAVDRLSPAAQAGIQPGDKVEKINGIKMIVNTNSASEAYKQFIFQTMSFRDIKTQYTNADGFTKCMHWDVFQYPKINEALKKPEYATVFSYLFYFEPYVNLSRINILSFEIKSSSNKKQVNITPNLRLESSFDTTY